jgi:hypothetical protein
MKYTNHVTIEDLKLLLSINSNSPKNKKNNNFTFTNFSKKYIYREFEKKCEKFIATNNFFISEEIADGNVEYIQYDYHNINKKMIPYFNNDNIYSYINYSNTLDEKYYKLIVLSNIKFNIDETNINKSEIIKRFIDNDVAINEDFVEDIYCNDIFSNKINIKLPDKYKFKNKNITLKESNIPIKYLFRIELLELNSECVKEINEYIG